MSKMKTRVIPAIVAAMALSMLAGCGGKRSEEHTSELQSQR